MNRRSLRPWNRLPLGAPVTVLPAYIGQGRDRRPDVYTGTHYFVRLLPNLYGPPDLKLARTRHAALAEEWDILVSAIRCATPTPAT